MNKQLRHWMFTLWLKDYKSNRLAEYVSNLTKIMESMKTTYSVYQFEEVEGGIHIQGYIELGTSMRGSTLKKKLTDEAWKSPHIEARSKSRLACKEYCSKLDTRLEGTEPVEYGTWRKETISKTKAEYKSCADLIKQGYDSTYIAYHHPDLFLKYGNRIASTIHYREEYLNSGRCQEIQILDKQGNEFFAEAKNNQEEE